MQHPEGGETMTAEERALLPVLKSQMATFAKRSYEEIAEMLEARDRHVESPRSESGEYLYVNIEPIQNLGAEHGDQIEVSVDVQVDKAHIGAYIYFAPTGKTQFSPKVYRRPLDPTISYNVCELDDLAIERAPSNP